MTSLPALHDEHRLPLGERTLRDLAQPAGDVEGLDELTNEAGERLFHRQGRYSDVSQLAADQTAIVSHDRGRTVAQNIIRRAIYAEDWTLVRIADASGIKLRALKSYFYEGKEPSYSSLSSIACVLGEWAVNMLLAPLGYKATPLDEPDDLQPQQVVADCLREFTVIAQACVDNRIDHSERPAVECAADAMIDKLLPLSSLAHAA